MSRDGLRSFWGYRTVDSPFDRDLFDHNADYIDRFAKVFPNFDLPDAELLPPGNAPAVHINGVKVTSEIHFRLRRLTKTNEVRVGAGMLRYAKGKTLPPAVGEWQSAYLLGYLHATNDNEDEQPEDRLCITVDAQNGATHEAPGNSVTRMKNMMAACETIAERWPAIKPPKGAVL